MCSSDLLVPLASGSFVVTETNTAVRKDPVDSGGSGTAERPLVVITTNEERELPEAFLRRCVVVWLDPPSEEQLVEIARAHMTVAGESFTQRDLALAKTMAREIMAARTEAYRRGIRPASTAEYLDALRACRSLGIAVDSEDWHLLRQFVFIKPQQPGGPSGEQSMAW